MLEMYHDMIGKHVKIYTDAHSNPEYAGKLTKGAPYLELNPGFNMTKIHEGINKEIQNMINSDPAIQAGIGLEQAKKEIEEAQAEMTVPKLAEQLGFKIRIPLERIVSITEIKEE